MAWLQLGDRYRPVLQRRGCSATEVPTLAPRAYRNENRTDHERLREVALGGFKNYTAVELDVTKLTEDCPDPRHPELSARHYHHMQANTQRPAGSRPVLCPPPMGARLRAPSQVDLRAPLKPPVLTRGHHKERFSRTEHNSNSFGPEYTAAARALRPPKQVTSHGTLKPYHRPKGSNTPMPSRVYSRPKSQHIPEGREAGDQQVPMAVFAPEREGLPTHKGVAEVPPRVGPLMLRGFL